MLPIFFFNYNFHFEGYPPQQPGFPLQSPGGFADPGYSGEDPEAKGFQFSDASIRRGFIRKVYAILMVYLYTFRSI